MATPVMTPGAARAYLATMRRRAAVHSQAYGATFRPKPSTSQRATIDAIASLRREHRRTLDPALRRKAVELLATAPILSVEEDPHFSGALQVLRGAAYFGVAEAPSVLPTLSHCTTHTYRLDGLNLYDLCRVLEELHHPQTAQVLGILRPRVEEVLLHDLTAPEAAVLLKLYHRHGLRTPSISRGVMEIIQRTIKDLPPFAVGLCVSCMPCMEAEDAKELLVRIDPVLCSLLHEECLAKYMAYRTLVEEALRDEDATRDGGKREVERRLELQAMEKQRVAQLAELNDVHRCLRRLLQSLAVVGWAPRRVLNALSRCILAWSLPLPAVATNMCSTSGIHFEGAMKEQEEIRLSLPRCGAMELATFLQLCHRASFRHPRALGQALSRFAVQLRHVEEEEEDGEEGLAVRTMRSSSSVASASMPTVAQRLHWAASAVEAAAFFFVPATETLDDVLDEIRRMLESVAVDARQLAAVVEHVARILYSVARWASGTPMTTSLRRHVDQLAQHPVLQRYAESALCRGDVLRTARLFRGVVMAQLPPLTNPSSSSSSSASAATSSAVVWSVAEKLLHGVHYTCERSVAKSESEEEAARCAIETMNAMRCCVSAQDQQESLMLPPTLLASMEAAEVSLLAFLARHPPRSAAPPS